MRTALIVLAAAPFALAALPAQAQRPDGDPVASAAIQHGQYAQAERQLTAQLRQNPGAPELLLNLAAIYAETGRATEARDLYRQVLAQRNFEMDLPGDRQSTSYAVANKGLQRVNALQLTSR